MTRTRLKRLLRWSAVVLAVGLVIVVGGSYWMGSRLVAPVPRAIGAAPDDLPLEDVAIPSESGSTLAGWFARAEGRRGTVVLLHPNRGSRRWMLGRARLLFAAGYSVLSIDFQAHGESPGEHITMGWLERHDAPAAVEFARQQSPGLPVAVVGVSLGGAAALLASPLNIDALVIESVYPTIEEAVDNRVRMSLGPLASEASELLLIQLEPRLGISPSDLRPIDHVANTGCPTLIMGGSLDQRTTPEETRRIYEQAAEPKQLVVFEGAAHQDLLSFAPEQYGQSVLAFLDTICDDRRTDKSSMHELRRNGLSLHFDPRDAIPGPLDVGDRGRDRGLE